MTYADLKEEQVWWALVIASQVAAGRTPDASEVDRFRKANTAVIEALQEPRS